MMARPGLTVSVRACPGPMPRKPSTARAVRYAPAPLVVDGLSVTEVADLLLPRTPAKAPSPSQAARTRRHQGCIDRIVGRGGSEGIVSFSKQEAGKSTTTMALSLMTHYPCNFRFGDLRSMVFLVSRDNAWLRRRITLIGFDSWCSQILRTFHPAALRDLLTSLSLV